MYALHFTHPGPSFYQDPPGAVGSFSVTSVPLGHGRTGECSVFACFFCWGSSSWRKPLMNMQTPHRKAREIAHLSTEGLGRTCPPEPTPPHANRTHARLAVRRQSCPGSLNPGPLHKHHAHSPARS